MTPNHVRHIVAPSAGTVLDALKEHLKVSEEQASLFLQLGSVYLNKRRISQDVQIKIGDYLRIHTRPKRYPTPNQLKNRLLHVDQWFVVIDKPSGVPCHATVDNGAENLLVWVGEELKQTMWVTHRLDVPTQGCLVLARSPEAASRFNILLQKDQLKKKYDVWVEGHIQQTGLVRHWMVDGQWAPREVRPEAFEKGLPCVLEIESVFYDAENDCSKIDIRLHTGRTHQIRAQMAALGHPVLGDGMYGSRHPLPRDTRIALRARELSFPHPFQSQTPQVFHAAEELAPPSFFMRTTSPVRE